MHGAVVQPKIQGGSDYMQVLASTYSSNETHQSDLI